MTSLKRYDDPRLTLGFEGSDDALVYQVSPDLAMVQTVDFFPPVVDDPYLFGQIAAANSLSDIYAMGARPAVAMNLLCVPSCLKEDIVREILAGGHDKAFEARCAIGGGHTIEDDEPKYGLCVTGFIHPAKVLTNGGARPGDILVLTKPLGSGVITTAAKADLASAGALAEAGGQMAALNKAASELAEDLEAHACTDVTGFGLLGHGLEIAQASGVSLEISASDLPLLPQARELAEMGILPGGLYRNMDYVAPYLRTADGVSQSSLDLLCDPQTSGGLLFALSPKAADELISRLESVTPWARRVGQVLPAGERALLVRP